MATEVYISDSSTIHTETHQPDQFLIQTTIWSVYNSYHPAFLFAVSLSATSLSFFVLLTFTHTERPMGDLGFNLDPRPLDPHQSGNVSQAESHINSFLEPDEVAATQHINNTLLLRPADLHAAFFKPTLAIWLPAVLADQRAINLYMYHCGNRLLKHPRVTLLSLTLNRCFFTHLT